MEINLETIKKNWYLILIAGATVILALVAVVTAVRLYQLGKEPVAPTAPESKPKAVAPECTMTFTLTPEGTPTPTPTGTLTPTPTPTGTLTPTPTPTGAPYACLDLTKDEPAPEPGDAVTFTCTADPGTQNIDHFNFRYQVDGGAYTEINDAAPQPPAADTAEIQLTITEGAWHVQCQVCVSTDQSNCTQWGAAH